MVFLLEGFFGVVNRFGNAEKSVVAVVAAMAGLVNSCGTGDVMARACPIVVSSIAAGSIILAPIAIAGSASVS